MYRLSRTHLVGTLLTLISLLLPRSSTAQERGWQHQDLHAKHIFGVSTNRADSALRGHPAVTPIVVAVIDVGVDIGHPVLRGVVWRNHGEQPENHRDDDHNGYVDDVNGWNFLGSSSAAVGNPDVHGNDTDPYAGHGTHVAGIIAGRRSPMTGMLGVADDVRIMAIRAIPSDGMDEQDKNVAKAIRYAVDNGARILNLSFGKKTSPQKALVDSAVQYAMSHNVLVVHSAGEAGVDQDQNPNYPTSTYADSGRAEAWIEVGASGATDDETLIGVATNYGQKTIDVFAPGVNILSAVQEGGYAAHSGTSMAAPIVSGIAALIWSRYPQLTAIQVKAIILESAVKVSHDVVVQDGSSTKTIPFSAACVSGGIVNAYAAVQLAAKYARQR